MIVAVEIAMLALLDVLLSGFRAAAGREGRINKVPHYLAALARAAAAGVILVAANAAIVGALVATAPEPAGTWQALVDAGGRSVWLFTFVALFTLGAICSWFSSSPVARTLPTLLVLGPLTLVRPLVIAGGLVYASLGAPDWRVWIVAVIAGVSMLGIEWVLGRPYVDRWRRLVQEPVVKVPLHSTSDASRLAALLLPQILPVFSVVAPGQAGASLVSVRRGTFTTGS